MWITLGIAQKAIYIWDQEILLFMHSAFSALFWTKHTKKCKFPLEQTPLIYVVFAWNTYKLTLLYIIIEHKICKLIKPSLTYMHNYIISFPHLLYDAEKSFEILSK